MEESTANKNITVAALDLGSNTFRLLVVEIKGCETTILLKRNATVQLGYGLSVEGGLAPDTVSRALAVLNEFRDEMDCFDIDCSRGCGTEVLRKAGNAELFLAAASKVVGVDIEVISGREEALLSWRGVLGGLAEATISFPLLVIDVGGGSTELIYIEKPAAQPRAASLSAGAVVFTELAGTGGWQSGFDVFSGQLRGFLEKLAVTEKISVVGTGGTATTLALLDLGLDCYDEKKVHGHKLMNAGIGTISRELTVMSGSARDSLPGLERGRGRIILAGLEIYQEILATIGVDGMIISDTGLLEGIMLSCLEHGSVSA